MEWREWGTMPVFTRAHVKQRDLNQARTIRDDRRTPPWLFNLINKSPGVGMVRTCQNAKLSQSFTPHRVLIFLCASAFHLQGSALRHLRRASSSDKWSELRPSSPATLPPSTPAPTLGMGDQPGTNPLQCIRSQGLGTRRWEEKMKMTLSDATVIQFWLRLVLMMILVRAALGLLASLLKNALGLWLYVLLTSRNGITEVQNRIKEVISQSPSRVAWITLPLPALQGFSNNCSCNCSCNMLQLHQISKWIIRSSLYFIHLETISQLFQISLPSCCIPLHPFASEFPHIGFRRLCRNLRMATNTCRRWAPKDWVKDLKISWDLDLNWWKFSRGNFMGNRRWTCWANHSCSAKCKTDWDWLSDVDVFLESISKRSDLDAKRRTIGRPTIGRPTLGWSIWW